MKRSHLVRDIIEVLAILVIIYIVIHFSIQSYHIDGSTMQPGLSSNQSVLVNKMAYLFQSPVRGDMVVLHNPLDVNKVDVKRIIGVPGDSIETDLLQLKVNGTVLKEPYVKTPANPEGHTWTVPANQYFVLDDNRQITEDSRTWGPVPKSYIVGKAVMVFWPLTNIHFIDTYPAVYSHINAKNAKS